MPCKPSSAVIGGLGNLHALERANTPIQASVIRFVGGYYLATRHIGMTVLFFQNNRDEASGHGIAQCLEMRSSMLRPPVLGSQPCNSKMASLASRSTPIARIQALPQLIGGPFSPNHVQLLLGLPLYPFIYDPRLYMARSYIRACNTSFRLDYWVYRMKCLHFYLDAI